MQEYKKHWHLERQIKTYNNKYIKYEKDQRNKLY